MRSHALISTALVLLACHRSGETADTTHLDTDTPDDTGLPCVDLDEDGYCADEDCDDTSAAVFPGAEELCNDIDDDCDGDIDEDPPSWFWDGDLDGFGDPSTEVGTCEPDEGWVDNGGDCDDSDPHTYPGAPELCDGMRNDCDQTDWTSSHEDGEVAFFDGSEWTRVTSTYARGSEDLPAWIELEESGLLQFCAGTYYLRLLIRYSDVELVGLYGAESTVLDGAGSVQVVLSYVGDLSLSGLTVTGGAVEGGTGFGGGVYVRQGTVEVRNAVLTGNDGLRGGGLYLYSGDATVEDSTIQGNTALEDGGGIGVDYGDLQVRDCLVSGNTSAEDGGGLHVYEGELTLENSRLYRNGATSKGGGAAVYEGSMTVSGTTLRENLGYSGGGVSVYTGDLEVRESNFELNSTYDSNGNGGGAYLRTGDVVIEASTFESNKAGARGNGGGLYVREGTASIDTSTFTANSAGQTGGGIRVYEGSVSLEDTLVEQNSAGNGAGVFVHTGVLSCMGSTSAVFGFEGNQASYFGGAVGIYFEPEVTSDACDWGTGSGENFPDDIALGVEDDVLEVSGLGDDETFTCDAKGCQ